MSKKNKQSKHKKIIILITITILLFLIIAIFSLLSFDDSSNNNKPVEKTEVGVIKKEDLSKIESNDGSVTPGESEGEKYHGGRLKPTSNGVPLSWTVGNYSYEELVASGHPEDAEVARLSRDNLIQEEFNRWGKN